MRVKKETTCYCDNWKNWTLFLLPSIMIDYRKDGLLGKTFEIEFCFLLWSVSIEWREI